MMNLVRVNRNPLFSDLFNQMWTDFDADIKEKPATNIIENEHEFKLEISIPGWSKEEVKVEIDKQLLLISGNKEESKEESKNEFLRKEFKKASFERSFTLPKEIDYQKIVAEHKNGILEISIPKNLEELEKMKRLIPVK
jgi:HSP20 family protein